MHCCNVGIPVVNTGVLIINTALTGILIVKTGVLIVNTGVFIMTQVSSSCAWRGNGFVIRLLESGDLAPGGAVGRGHIKDANTKESSGGV